MTCTSNKFFYFFIWCSPSRIFVEVSILHSYIPHVSSYPLLICKYKGNSCIFGMEAWHDSRWLWLCGWWAICDNDAIASINHFPKVRAGKSRTLNFLVVGALRRLVGVGLVVMMVARRLCGTRCGEVRRWWASKDTARWVGDGATNTLLYAAEAASKFILFVMQRHGIRYNETDLNCASLCLVELQHLWNVKVTGILWVSFRVKGLARIVYGCYNFRLARGISFSGTYTIQRSTRN